MILRVAVIGMASTDSTLSGHLIFAMPFPARYSCTSGSAGAHYLPAIIVTNTLQKRQETLLKTFPDALDMLVASVETLLSPHNEQLPLDLDHRGAVAIGRLGRREIMRRLEARLDTAGQ